LFFGGLGFSGLSLSAGCQQNAPPEIAGWILVGDHSVKDNKLFLGYTLTIIRYLNRIKLSK